MTSLRTMVAGRGMAGVRSQEADCVCASTSAVDLSDLATQPASTAHAHCRPDIPAVVRIDGNWVSAPATRFLEMREAGGSHQHQACGVSGPGGFHSSVWRRAAHVDNRAAQSGATALCAIVDARGTTLSYAAIGL